MIKRALSVILIFLITCKAFSQTTSGVIELNNSISNELALKLSGVKVAVIPIDKEKEVMVMSDKSTMDLYRNLQKFLKEYLPIEGCLYLPDEVRMLIRDSNFDLCDVVKVIVDVGDYKVSLGAIGKYNNASLLFHFCDGSIYRVKLLPISTDGYSYHPNRIAAAFGKIARPALSYSSGNKVQMKKLPLISSETSLDQDITNSKTDLKGIFQSFGLDANSQVYQLALIDKEDKIYLVYVAGAGSVWSKGELKAELIATKNPYIFLSKWYGSYKEIIENVTVEFTDPNTFSIISGNSKERFVRLK
jgi:hypothetical protein